MFIDYEYAGPDINHFLVVGKPNIYEYEKVSNGGTLLKFAIAIPPIDNEARSGMYFTVYWQENITKTLWDRTQYRHIQPLRSIHNVLQSLDPDFMQKLESEDEKFKGIIGYIGRRNKTSEVVYEKARANSDYYFDTENSLMVATGSVGSVMYRDQVANDSNICLAMGLEFSTGDYGQNFKP